MRAARSNEPICIRSGCNGTTSRPVVQKRTHGHHIAPKRGRSGARTDKVRVLQATGNCVREEGRVGGWFSGPRRRFRGGPRGRTHLPFAGGMHDPRPGSWSHTRAENENALVRPSAPTARREGNVPHPMSSLGPHTRAHARRTFTDTDTQRQRRARMR